jgi:hypothetical protein
MANFDNISFSHLIRLWGIPMRTLRDAESDVVLLALFGTSAVVVLIVCLLGLISLSTNWEGLTCKTNTRWDCAFERRSANRCSTFC